MYFGRSILHAQSGRIVLILPGRGSHLDDVIRLAVGQNDQNAMLRVIVLHHSGRQTNRKSVPVGSCCKIIKDFPVPVGFLIIPIEIHDRISIQGAE